MLCCGLGKQKPYVHSGKLEEGKAEVKNTDLGFLGFTGAEGAQQQTRLDLFTSGCRCGVRLGSAGICNSGLTAETEPIDGIQYHPAPALLRCGTA